MTKIISENVLYRIVHKVGNMAQRDYYYQEGRQGSAAIAPAQSRSSRRRRIPSGFTYISGCVKYTMFFFNFLFWLSGLLLLGVL